MSRPPADAPDAAPAAPLADTAAWTAFLAPADLPVPAASAAALARLSAQEAAREGSVDANRIGETLGRDPLSTLRVLAHLARHRPARRMTDPNTVTAAAVLLGVPPFLRAFAAPPTAEARLAGRPEALAGLHAALGRASRAAELALAFAAQRGDVDAALAHQAALLHRFPLLLLWCLAPQAALSIDGAQDAAALAALQWSLAEAWRLPAPLRRPERERDALLPRSRCVALAVRLATGEGGDAALHEAAELLALPLEDARRLMEGADPGAPWRCSRA